MDFLVLHRFGTDANVRECDNVGWLGKVMCHDDVTGSNRAEAREVPALNLFQREVPKLYYRPTWKGTEKSQYHGLRGIVDEFYLGDEKPTKKDAPYVVFSKVTFELRVPLWPWYLMRYGILNVGQWNLTS